MASIDGASELADRVRLRLVTVDGVELGPGLHEQLYEHFYATGRLPADPLRDNSDGARD